MKVDACRRQNCLSTKMSLGVFRWSYGSTILKELNRRMTHGFTKEGAVPDTEITRAMHAKELVESNRDRYTMVWEL